MTRDPLIQDIAAIDDRFAANTQPKASDTRFAWEVTGRPDWWEQRLAEASNRWNTTDLSVLGALWWFSASHTLSGLALVPLMHRGIGFVTSGQDSIWMRPNGYLGACEPHRSGGWDSTANELAELLTETIGMLSAVTGLKADNFWALSTDSLAGTALRVGSALTSAVGALSRRPISWRTSTSTVASCQLRGSSTSALTAAPATAGRKSHCPAEPLAHW